LHPDDSLDLARPVLARCVLPAPPAARRYLLDWIYGYFFNVHHMETLYFTRLGAAIEVVWENPKNFNSDGAGYVYINLPWIDRTDWHAFSLVKHPSAPPDPFSRSASYGRCRDAFSPCAWACLHASHMRRSIRRFSLFLL
jgi:hypothetical protein